MNILHENLDDVKKELSIIEGFEACKSKGGKIDDWEDYKNLNLSKNKKS